MKKKIVLISLAIALVAILTVGGSLAYFMDTDDVTNVFTVGSVDIEQNEEFVQESQLLPVVGTDPTKADDNYIQKKVTVENKGKNGAYVQTLVAVPACLDNAGVLKLWDTNASANGWTKLDGDANVNGVQPLHIATIDNMLYNVYVYRYNTVLTAGSETAAWLASLISRIVLECREERLLHQKYLSQLLSCILLELLRLQDNLYHRSNECKALQLPAIPDHVAFKACRKTASVFRRICDRYCGNLRF